MTMSRSTPPESFKVLGLVCLSLSLMPLSFLVVCYALLWGCARGVGDVIAGRRQKHNHHGKRTVLVTGVGMAKGLSLARAFHLAGHRVIGADFESFPIPCSGRFSKSIAAFYALTAERGGGKAGSKPSTGHTEQLVDVVRKEKVDLWVSCSGVVTALEDAEAKAAMERYTACKCVQPDTATTATLHEKNTFAREMGRLDLPVPETFEVTSADQLLSLLSRPPSSSSSSSDGRRKRRYMLKPVGVDDVYRNRVPLLPRPRQSDTEAVVRSLPMSEAKPWILQQFIEGGHEYCTHALVVGGEVKCFVACRSSDLLMHYEALPASSKACRDMLQFTRDYLARSGASVTGHLSFDFMSEDGDEHEGEHEGEHEERLYAIECNPRAHTAVVLFAQQGDAMDAMVRAYLSAVEERSPANGSDTQPIYPPAGHKSRYWIGHDVVSLLALPTLDRMRGRASLPQLASNLQAFGEHLLWWKEGTFEWWDPMPAFVLYHVYWPMVILAAWMQGRRWSRANVSTNKMFLC